MKAVIVVALLLAGCNAEQTAGQMCRDAIDVPAWDHCIERANARVAARRERQIAREESNDDAMATAIIVGSFLRPQSCMNIGGIVTCN